MCPAKRERHNRMRNRRVHARETFIYRTRKGLKMLDALERVLKGLKPVGRDPLPSALIEISLSRFYYLGMDAVAHTALRRGASAQPWRYG